MPGVLNKIFTPRRYDEEVKLQRKISALKKKSYWFIIFPFLQYYFGLFEDGTWQLSLMRFSFIRPCSDPQFFCYLIPYVKFNKVSFGGQNVCPHSLIAIKREKNIACPEM